MEQGGGDVPSGLVTFLFTDVEGSTRLWAADEQATSASLRVHDEVVRREVDRHGGYVFTTAGDSFSVAFQRASEGIGAASDIQRGLGEVAWPGPRLCVRMGLHLGEAEERGGDYFGPVVNLAARVAATGHGGQVLLTGAVRAATDVEGIDLGEHRLRDVPVPVRIWQLGSERFPLLRSVGAHSNLPVPASRLFGRDNDVRDVRVLLSEHRLVTMLAMGGSGKTRLAVAVGDAELGHRRDGVWFADLATATGDGDVGPVVAAALGLEVSASDYVSKIAGSLADRQLLLILDNCEHVIDACAELVEAILSAGGSTAILATSREWLDIDGERVYRVRPLDGADADSPAVRLFADRAVAIAPDFVLDADNLPHVAELCRRLDGLPLAIELAASRVAVMSPEALAAGLDDRFALLSEGRRRRRGRTLQATIDWSYDLLDDEEQEVFRGLGVFSGSFDLPAVAAVCEVPEPEAADIVESLLGRSLVSTSDDGPGRFRLLETIRAYVENRPTDAGEVDRRRELHAAHFAARARFDNILYLMDLFRLARLRADRSNLQVAADWLEGQHRWEDLADVVHSTTPLQVMAAPVQLARVRRCLAYDVSPGAKDGLRAAEGYLTIAIGDWSGLREPCEALQASDDVDARVFGLVLMSLSVGRRTPERAYQLLDRVVDLSGPDPSSEVRLAEASYRCLVAANSNDLPVAQELADRVRQLYDGRFLPSGTRHALLISGITEWCNGDASRLADAIETVKSAGTRDPAGSQTLEFVSALVAVSTDVASGSNAIRRYALDVASGPGVMPASDALILLSELAARQGDAERAVALLRSTGDPRGPFSTLVAHQLAERLGVHEEIEHTYAENATDREWMVERPKQALLAELRRRGWSDPEHHTPIRTI